MPTRLLLLWALACLVGFQLVACDRPRGSAQSGLQGLTAIDAVRSVSDELHRRHADGAVAMIAGASVDASGRDQQWTLTVVEPEKRREFEYVVVGGGLRGPEHSTEMTREHIAFPLAGGAPRDFVDSDRAVQIAERAGAATYRQRSGANLVGAHLFVDHRGVPVWFLWYAKSGATPTAMAEIDARNGQVLLYEEERQRLIHATAGPVP